MFCMNNKRRLAFRAWYYLRTGYSIYLALTLAGINSMVTVYYLAINNIPSLKVYFPDFTTWAAVLIGTVVPFAVFLGWLHFKRSQAYTSEIEVSTEVNPFYYKLPPGYTKEVLFPMYIEVLRTNLKILNKETLTEEEKKNVLELLKKMENLTNGGYEGWPAGRALPASLARKNLSSMGKSEPNA